MGLLEGFMAVEKDGAICLRLVFSIAKHRGVFFGGTGGGHKF